MRPDIQICYAYFLVFAEALVKHYNDKRKPLWSGIHAERIRAARTASLVESLAIVLD